VKVTNFNQPHLHLSPPLGVIPFEFRRVLWCQKNRVPGLSCGIICVILCLAVLIQYRSVTDTHTHTDRTTAYTALSIASRDKTCNQWRNCHQPARLQQSTQQRVFHLWLNYSILGIGRRRIVIFVCSSVCLSVCLHEYAQFLCLFTCISEKPHGRILPNFLCLLSVDLAALEYAMYTSGSVDDINMFSLNGPSGGVSYCSSIVLLLQQPSCSAVHQLILLLHDDGCVLS